MGFIEDYKRKPIVYKNKVRAKFSKKKLGYAADKMRRIVQQTSDKVIEEIPTGEFKERSRRVYCPLMIKEKATSIGTKVGRTKIKVPVEDRLKALEYAVEKGNVVLMEKLIKTFN